MVSDPEAGTIELSLLVPATDGSPRTLHLYICVQVRDATDVSATLVPRIFAEMVSQKGSVQWILEQPDHDLASLVREIETYLSSRAGA